MALYTQIAALSPINCGKFNGFPLSRFLSPHLRLFSRSALFSFGKSVLIRVSRHGNFTFLCFFLPVVFSSSVRCRSVYPKKSLFFREFCHISVSPSPCGIENTMRAFFTAYHRIFQNCPLSKRIELPRHTFLLTDFLKTLLRGKCKLFEEFPALYLFLYCFRCLFHSPIQKAAKKPLRVP